MTFKSLSAVLFNLLSAFFISSSLSFILSNSSSKVPLKSKLSSVKLWVFNWFFSSFSSNFEPKTIKFTIVESCEISSIYALSKFLRLSFRVSKLFFGTVPKNIFAVLKAFKFSIGSFIFLQLSISFFLISKFKNSSLFASISLLILSKVS